MSAIVVAPFSNDDIRDWPADHYVALVGRLLAGHPGSTVRIVGAPGQRLRACEIVRSFDPDRVANDCGRAAWPETVARLRSAACVIGNNSGIAHLAARLGAPTVCVFGGSHQRREWRPLGFDVVVVSRAIACSPCHRHRAASCPHDLACLREIAPAAVAAAADAIMARTGRTPSTQGAGDMRHAVPR